MFDSSKIKAIAQSKNVSMTSLAEKIGVTRVGLQKIFERNSTNIETIQKIADALDCSPLEFYTEYERHNYSFINTGNNYSPNSVVGSSSDEMFKLKEQLLKAEHEKELLEMELKSVKSENQTLKETLELLKKAFAK